MRKAVSPDPAAAYLVDVCIAQGLASCSYHAFQVGFHRVCDQI